jgi:predicted lipid-binding transport protein (Tim44 family)
MVSIRPFLERDGYQLAVGAFMNLSQWNKDFPHCRACDPPRPGITAKPFRRFCLRGMAWLIVLLLAACSPGDCWARGGGGCVIEGTIVLTPDGPTAIESLHEGDLVWGVDSGVLQPARVAAVTKLQVEAYLEIAAGETNLLITPEHPVMVGPGEFRNAGLIQPGDRVIVDRGSELQAQPVRSVRRVHSDRPAYNLLVSPGGTFLPAGIAVHNKGCFLPDNLILLADGREVPISTIQPGELLLAFTSEGSIVRTQVRKIVRLEVDEYVVLKTDRETLQVTADHPFFVGEGTFKTVEALQVGSTIIAWDGQSLARQQIFSMETVPGRILVYNLQTEHPHTFFVGHVAVHNKGGGGGGGCFPAGALITTPLGKVPIESLIPGDVILSLTDAGLLVPATVRALLVARNALLKVETRRGLLEASPEHPVGVAGGGNFQPLSEFRRGDRILHWAHGRLASDRVCRVSQVLGEKLVFNLQVDVPHTFFASSFLVHNKGGSFGGSHSSSSSGSGGSTDDPTAGLIVILIILTILMIMVILRRRARRSKSENLDFVYSPSAVARKAGRTEKLLQFLSRQDPSVAPEALRKDAESTFRKLQECWEKRDYGPMEPFMMASLFAQHMAQIRGMIRNREINRIQDLKVEKVDLVNVRYPDKPIQREFTALISASARDYYVEEASGKFIRGDKASARFQEFWTFQLLDHLWLLRDVEQAGESDYLKDENFVEMLTDQNLQGIYGEAAGKEGEAGPWLEKGVEEKATRIERMLNFLAQTDKLWNRQQMQERARQVFLRVYLAREGGDLGQTPAEDLFPAVADSLRDQIRQWQIDDVRVEYRNLCVRKVEVVLVRNFAERSRDEFTVRVSAHAQKIVRKGGLAQHEDRYVTPFEEYWTFGRLDEQWKLKEVLPPAEGKKRMVEDNVDEDSSAGQLQWYYRQTRAN